MTHAEDEALERLLADVRALSEEINAASERLKAKADAVWATYAKRGERDA